MWLKKKWNKNRLCGKKISADRKEIKQYLQIWWRLRSINWCGSVQLYGPNWVSAGRWTERIFQRKSSVIKITQYKQWDGQNKRTVLAVKKKKAHSLDLIFQLPWAYSSMHDMPPWPIGKCWWQKHSVCVKWNTSEMPSDSWKKYISKY